MKSDFFHYFRGIKNIFFFFIFTIRSVPPPSPKKWSDFWNMSEISLYFLNYKIINDTLKYNKKSSIKKKNKKHEKKNKKRIKNMKKE
jgi:uncharacterized membrane protein required for colicin V production